MITSVVPYFRVSDMARSLRFYCDGVGFSVVRQLDDERGPFWARLEQDGYALMISNRPSRFIDAAGHEAQEHEHDEEGRHRFEGVRAAHLGELNFVTFIYVADADAAYNTLTSRGVQPLEQPSDSHFGFRSFTIVDPDGYYFTLAQVLA
jgi:catechol 2,3-dioxygenase-like lactoylglutathione lyase family enzyme